MRLTQRINAALLVIGIIPLVLLTTYALGWFHDSVRQHSRQALESLATQVTKEVSRSLQDGSNALDFLGKHIALLNPDTPEETLKAVLLDTVSFHPILNDIYVLDPSSRVRASARYSFRGEWTQNIWFRKALDSERVRPEWSISKTVTGLRSPQSSPCPTTRGPWCWSAPNARFMPQPLKCSTACI